MAADLTFGKYDSPVSVGPCQSEWVIVSCWGQSADYLSLSLTNIFARRLGPAPRGLQPASTYLGILLARTVTPTGEEAEYLLLRQRPPSISVGGVFHPSDGYVRVVQQQGQRQLTARGRYAHCHGSCQGSAIVHDIPYPAPGYDKACSWHLSAVQRPWIGEFSPDTDITAGSVVRLEPPSKPRPKSTEARRTRRRVLDALPA